MIDVDIDADDAPSGKKSFLTKKVLIIILSGFAFTATSGAAAVVFVSPGFLDKNITGLACDVVHEVEGQDTRVVGAQHPCPGNHKDCCLRQAA